MQRYRSQGATRHGRRRHRLRTKQIVSFLRSSKTFAATGNSFTLTRGTIFLLPMGTLCCKFNELCCCQTETIFFCRGTGHIVAFPYCWWPIQLTKWMQMLGNMFSAKYKGFVSSASASGKSSIQSVHWNITFSSAPCCWLPVAGYIFALGTAVFSLLREWGHWCSSFKGMGCECVSNRKRFAQNLKYNPFATHHFVDIAPGDSSVILDGNNSTPQ